MKTLLTLMVMALVPWAGKAATTIDPGNLYAYGANIGWIDTRGNTANGASIGEFICAGSIYSANCGWINLGNGAPANGVRYQNDSVTDFGVNTQHYTSNGTVSEAKLRGFAYGANIGWVNFEATGDPRLNLATGQLLGYAYSANVGWIALSGLGVTVKTTSIAVGADTDVDGISDAWEYSRAGNLTRMSASTDDDGDGVLDKDEYVIDSDPLDPNDRLEILSLVQPRQLVANGPFVADLTWTSQPTRSYSIEASSDLSLWTVSATDIPSAGPATTLSFADVDAPARFYRVRATRPLAP